MKTITYSVLFSLLSISLIAQDDSTKIANIYQHIFDDMGQKKYSTALDYTYPKFFEQFPREMMEKVMEQSLNQENMEIGFLENEILGIKPFFSKDGIAYQKVTYKSKMFMRFTDDTLVNKEDSTFKFNVKDMMLASLNKSFGAENVSFEEASSTFLINATKNSMALLDPAYGEAWKIINIEPNMTPILQKIIPLEVIEAFGSK